MDDNKTIQLNLETLLYEFYYDLAIAAKISLEEFLIEVLYTQMDECKQGLIKKFGLND